AVACRDRSEGRARQAAGTGRGDRAIEGYEGGPKRKLVFECLGGKLDLGRPPAEVKETAAGCGCTSDECLVHAREGWRVEYEDVREAPGQTGLSRDGQMVREANGVGGEVAGDNVRPGCGNGPGRARPAEAQGIELALEQRPSPRHVGDDDEQRLSR